MTKTISSAFYCLKCATKTALPRKMSRMREKGHFKKIYCITCKDEINHLEVREFDLDFNVENLKRDIGSGKYNEVNKGIKQQEKGIFDNEKTL